MGRWLDFESNPWGQEVLQGVSLDLMYLAIGLAVLFTLGHWFWYRRRGFSKQEEVAEAQGSVAGIPERIVRHTLASRIFHWSMAASMLVLLVTAFVPLLGLEFAWVTILDCWRGVDPHDCLPRNPLNWLAGLLVHDEYGGQGCPRGYKSFAACPVSEGAHAGKAG